MITVRRLIRVTSLLLVVAFFAVTARRSSIDLTSWNPILSYLTAYLNPDLLKIPSKYPEQGNRPYPPLGPSEKILGAVGNAYETERKLMLSVYEPIELARPPAPPLSDDAEKYISRLTNFVEDYLSKSPFKADLLLMLARLSHHISPPLRMDEPIRRRVISSCQDGRAGLPDFFEGWENRLGPVGWEVEVLGDEDMEVLFDRLTGTSGGQDGSKNATSVDEGVKTIRKAWDALPKPVLKTDLLRYLAVLVEGGIYTDSDTQPRAHPFLWGRDAVPLLPPTIAALREVLQMITPPVPPSEVKDQISMNGNSNQDQVYEPGKEQYSKNYADAYHGGINDPDIALVVSIEWDSFEREMGESWREIGYARSLQVVQWTMMAKPFHPIMLDVLQNVVSNVEKCSEEGCLDGSVGALDLTGPGPFTDAVFRYLLVQYGITPADVTKSKQNMRIGEVLLLAEWSFAQPAPQLHEWDYTGPEPERRPVSHGFMGRWKHEGWGD